MTRDEFQKAVDDVITGCIRNDYSFGSYARKVTDAVWPVLEAAEKERDDLRGMPEFDGLLDHIYEHGTAAEGVIEKANAFARAVIARYAPQQPANDEVVFIDGVGAGRRSVESCRDGVQWIMVGDRVYWPLSESDAKRLQSACCGNGHFDGPSTHVGEGEQQ